METFSKNNIIELARGKKDTYYEERTLNNHLDKILEFLDSKRVQRILNRNSDGSGIDLFLKELNFSPTRSNENKGSFQFNLTTTIFLALLLITYDEPYFEQLLNGKFVLVDDGDEWIAKLSHVLELFKTDWERSTGNTDRNRVQTFKNRSWENVRINIMSQLYRFTLPEINEELVEDMVKQVQGIIEKFLAMGDKSKIDAYEYMKSRLDYIDKKIIGRIVDEMDGIEKLVYNTNLKLNHNEYTLLDYLKEFNVIEKIEP